MMRDIVISSKRIRTELRTLLICFIIANLVNLYAIIAYDTSYLELLSQVGYILMFSLVLYLAWCFLRVIFYGINKLIKSNNKA